jgi:hypothetical protein
MKRRELVLLVAARQLRCSFLAFTGNSRMSAPTSAPRAKRKCCERHDFDAPDPSATSARNFAVMHSSVFARRCDNVAASSPRRAAREAT